MNVHNTVLRFPHKRCFNLITPGMCMISEYFIGMCLNYAIQWNYSLHYNCYLESDSHFKQYRNVSELI